MAACRSLQHIFENPLPENPTLLESLSPWNQIKKTSISSVEQSSSFTEIFGELHFKENSSLFQTPPEIRVSPSTEYRSSFPSSRFDNSHKNCTEGLGFESFDEVEDLVGKNESDDSVREDRRVEEWRREIGASEFGRRRSRISPVPSPESFPPPISCLRKNGQPRVCFESFREDGRFVLKEIRVRSQEILHACREDGRLKLHFVRPNFDDSIGEDDGENDDDVEGETEDENGFHV